MRPLGALDLKGEPEQPVGESRMQRSEVRGNRTAGTLCAQRAQLQGGRGYRAGVFLCCGGGRVQMVEKLLAGGACGG